MDIYDDIDIQAEKEKLINPDDSDQFQSKRIADRENDYQKRRFDRDLEGATYKDLMQQKGKEPSAAKEVVVPPPTPRKRRWDVSADESSAPTTSEWEKVEGKKSRWDDTPVQDVGATPVQSKWDQTPAQTPSVMSTPRYEQELQKRNRYLTDEELNSMFPATGYVILEAPANYKPVTPSRKLDQTPVGFTMDQPEFEKPVPEIPGVNGLQFFRDEDSQYFGKLMDTRDDMDLTMDELKERKMMRLLLKIKNGTPQARKVAMRQITENARLFGAELLFDHILPLLMSPSLEDQERHLLVKVIDRVMFKLDEQVRPYAHKILVVIEPMLIDEDYYTRTEGREIISNLAKAAGLATMISVMRPDIDHADEYVRNTTARAFAVVASALGIQTMVPFLKAVCRSKKSWQARHTGIKIVQQIAILVGCAVLPHLKSLVLSIGDGLIDEQPKVRTMTALALSALAEASFPYGIESFKPILGNLFEGIKRVKGKNLAAFLKAAGFIVPLFDSNDVMRYTRKIVPELRREFSSHDDEMRKIVLKVLKQCISSDGMDAPFIKQELLDEFFGTFWKSRKITRDRRNYKQLVETTVEIANKVGVSSIISRVVDGFKDEDENYRRMVSETTGSILKSLGGADLDDRMVELLIDGILFAFQEQVSEDSSVLECFGTTVSVLGVRVKPYIPQIVSTILWRLNNKSAKVRQQAADLVAEIANVMRLCGEEKLMGQLGAVLYEYLGEEYPDVLGSILKGLKAIVNCIGMAQMTPPIKDLLPRLTPILKNRHEKVQEHVVDLVGRIADRGAEFVSAREWMRICFELLDMLRTPRKSIRRAAVNTFGYIAKAIGPQDVLSTLLNNLKVQERQNRVSTTVAIAIVAETCSPFTVLPALMNEYRVPEMNVQNGCLKSLSFLFEYIGEMAKDYIWAVSVLLEDALMDRDLVHRQIACSTVKHLALGVVGLGHEDAITHLLNLVWPNIFETSPHFMVATADALEGCRVALGPSIILSYCLQGLFHPARRVREIYWRVI
jgi:splicing factor 3B subunit 1